MTDREERQHVIEVLQNMVDWMEAANYIVATPERRHALDYAISSIETDLKYDLLYEETSGQADKQADKPITKNDVPDINVGKIGSTPKNNLGVDCIVDVLGSYTDLDIPYKREIAENILANLPSTPQEPRKGHWIGIYQVDFGEWQEYDVKLSDGFVTDNCHCSECGEELLSGDRGMFCPLCGAKMVEPQESEG